MMGNRMRAAGREVVLSRSVIEHHIGNDGFAKNWKHRMRWARSTRRSRPWGYAGQLFTHPVVLGLLLTAANSDWWELMVAALIFRLGVAWCMAVRTLRDTKMPWWLLPVSDGSSFAVWALGFFGRRISWRGRMLVVASDGTFEVSA
jgi:ceramide glucosyltransferase